MKFLTIVTPTYNRGEKLKNLYESLKRQINKNFTWLIVDDGSKDNTKQCVEEIKRDSNFDIIYIYKENGGKHTAINVAMKQVDSELTMIVDSDDLLTADATETIFQDWLKYGDQPKLGGLIYLRGYSSMDVIGDKWPYDEMYGNMITHICNKGIKGDKAEVFQSQLLKNTPFPEFPGENFLSENIVWLTISRSADVMMRNKVIYITEYLEDGLTKSGRKKQVCNPIGALENAKVYLYSQFSLKLRIKNGLLYNCYGLFAGWSFKKLWENSPSKLITTICFLPGVVLKKKWEKFRV